ncbi:MAG TPA: MFS transporter [Xanthobacteraceae bacterium]|nr:MFS transporter [Xanthobacteraceae bacterium]
MRAPGSNASDSLGRALTCIGLLWLAGIGLRLTILAVPPVIPLIHDDLNMSATQIGILTGLPSVLFAFAAIPGSLLIARFGALLTLMVGLLATAAGSALRGAAPDVILLYAATILTGFGVAVMQPSLPPLVRAWLPQRIGFGTAVYTNGLLVGEILPVALTLPVILPFLGGSWRLGFVAWAVPVVVIAILVVTLAPRSAEANGAPAAARRWWPDWSSGLIWRLGLMLGSVNATYFATNAFLPDYLHHLGHTDLISPALTALNVGQLPASFLLLAVAGRLERHAWPYVVCGLLSLAALLGIMFGSGAVIIAASALIGFSCAATLVLMLALPPLLGAPEDVHRISAAMFTISYTCAVIVPVISGFLWDSTGVPAAAFVPIAASTFLLIGFAGTIGFRAHGESAEDGHPASGQKP